MDATQMTEVTSSRQAEMCDDFGYYEVSTGYRKIPGDICTGGVQLQPTIYYCRGGFVRHLFSWTGVFMMIVCGAVLYYGWPVIEAIVILLPIPDPKILKESIMGYASKAWGFFMGLIGKGANSSSEGYQQDLENMKPNTFMPEDDDDDDDENDVGK
jgi:hypothetical protein